MSPAAYFNLVCLKEDLERIVSRHDFASTFTLRKREFDELHSSLMALKSMLEISVEKEYIRNPLSSVLITLIKDLELFYCSEQFRKHCRKFMLLKNIPFNIQRWNTNHSNLIEFLDSEKAVIRNKDMSPFFCIDEFKALYHQVVLIDGQLTNSKGGSYLESVIRDAMISLKTDIEKDLEHLTTCNLGFQEFIDNVLSTDSVVTDAEEDSTRNQIRHLIFSVKQIHDGIVKVERNCTKNFVLCMKEELEHKMSPVFCRNIQRLYNNVSLLVSSLRNSRKESASQEVMINVQKRIRDVAHKAAVQLGGHRAVQLRVGRQIQLLHGGRIYIVLTLPTSGEEIKASFDLILDLPKLIEETAYCNKELMKIHKDREEIGKTGPQNSDGTSTTAGKSTVLNPSRSSRTKDGKLVGLGKDLEKMLDCLSGQSLRFTVFPIIGMAGIGKTTFAKELYDHPVVMHHFDTRAWVIVSQEYQLRGLLLGLLSCLTNPSNEILESTNEQLKEKLYRYLKGRRYLVVLDDVWDKVVWDDLRRSFPNDMNGSRILLTSRLKDVGIHASSDVPPHCLPFLNVEESWELFCSKSFANESCPIELLSVGWQIVDKCHGFPLAIVVVGGLLSRMNKTLAVWEEVAQNVGSLVMDGPQHCQDIIALSYNNLPNPLKACFLYMAIFPEDYEISSRKLISLWIAEGFVQPEEKKSLEKIAEDYLEDLIARCIILVKRNGSNGRIKTCSVHDLIRDFCLRESQKENFLDVVDKLTEAPINNIHGIQRYGPGFYEKCTYDCPRLSIHSNLYSFTKVRVSSQCNRSFFCFETLGPNDLKSSPGIIFSKLLKVLDIMHIHLSSLPFGFKHLISLKYLALTIQNSFSLSEIFKLGRLQTCNIKGEFSGHIPNEFWCMTELRHFYVRKRVPVSHQTKASGASIFSASTIQENLQYLSTVGPSTCTEENFLRLPNLKKLGVYESEEDYQFVGWYKNLVHLTQLETLKYAFSNPFGNSVVRPRHCLPSAVFPPNLKKLTLGGFSFPWEDMKQLCMLPKLEVLKLKNYAFSGAVWNLGKSCFESLKFLMIGSTNLEVWEADGSHFPSLEHLVLRNCRFLKEIPHGIGNARCLERIEMHNCADSAATSAMRLEEEQQDLGNEMLKIYVTRRHFVT